MKKIILIFISFLCISCSHVDSYFDGEIKNKLVMKGYRELMTAQEKEEFETSKKFEAIMFKTPYRGMLAQSLKMIADSIPNQEDLNKTAFFIEKYQNKIIIFDNASRIPKVIKYMGTSEGGRETLKNCRFLFLNNIFRTEIEKLSKEFGFKYSYPKVKDVK